MDCLQGSSQAVEHCSGGIWGRSVEPDRSSRAETGPDGLGGGGFPGKASMSCLLE